VRQWIAALLPECAVLLPATPEHGPATIASQTDPNTCVSQPRCAQLRCSSPPRTAAWCRAPGGSSTHERFRCNPRFACPSFHRAR
jgi:hypothetical protein